MHVGTLASSFSVNITLTEKIIGERERESERERERERERETAVQKEKSEI